MIAISTLLWAALAAFGVLLACFGALGRFAAGMSSASDDGTAKRGCQTFLIGAVLVVAGLYGVLT